MSTVVITSWGSETQVPPTKRFRWIHWVPLLHLLICLVAASGYVAPILQPLGILFTFLVLIDFPISVVYGLLVWQHAAFAFVWLAVAGTCWWYLLCRGCDSTNQETKSEAKNRSPASGRITENGKGWLMKLFPLKQKAPIREAFQKSNTLETHFQTTVASFDCQDSLW
jgi:hypothetical protein